MSRCKTLVILTPAFPADESPVNWVTTQQLFVKTVKETFPHLKVIVLSLYYPYSASSYEWHGIPVTSFNGTLYRKVRRILFWRRIWKQLSAIRRREEVIGLFSFWCGECALIGHYFGKRYDIRHYCWLCGQDARKTNRLVKFIHPRPDELIAMSDFLEQEFFRNHGIRPQYMIPNGIAPKDFPSSGTGLRDIDILGVGTLSRFKQYHLFVDIIDSLRQSLPAIKGIHCGEGEDRERIQAQIGAKGLEAHFTLLGETPHQEVLAIMQRTKILLHTSDYEGFGVVCLEALYAGAHVISFIKPMNREIAHWHVVRTMEEMTEKARQLLSARDTEYTPVCPYLMEDTVKAVLRLYDPEEEKARVMGENLSYHDQAADSYDQTMEQDPVNKKIRQRVKEKFCQLLPSGLVMDFGGGTGQDLEWLTGHSYEVLFCEPSVAMRGKAIRYNDTVLRSNRITFLDSASTDFSTWHQQLPSPQKVDAVLSDFGALNYIPDIRSLFSNMARIIRPGGHFVLLVLKLNLKKRMKWHRRNALRSLLFRTPFVLYIPYERTRRQTVFVHTLKEIETASAPYFTLDSEEGLDEYDFTLIHLVRNEKQD
jgi:glycosyltransferase involved in cell wall biosynthesis/ubiquinone/menaquinone biosynthesis C-methylase UbiE